MNEGMSCKADDITMDDKSELLKPIHEAIVQAMMKSTEMGVCPLCFLHYVSVTLASIYEQATNMPFRVFAEEVMQGSASGYNVTARVVDMTEVLQAKAPPSGHH